MAGTNIGFRSVESVEKLLVQGQATNLGGFTVNQDFDPEIEYYLRKETIFWQLIRNRKPAQSAIIKKIREGALPTVGFVNRSNLGGAPHNPLTATQNQLDDPGQEVKALAGTIEFPHFERSLYEQQNRPYGDTVADETKDLLVSMARFLEMSLFTGDATADPMSFNGIDRLMNTVSQHVFTVDKTVVGTSISRMVNEVVVRATTDRNILRKITHIICSGAGSLAIQEEIGQTVYYTNTNEVVPNVRVPGIMTANGQIPIVPTPYIDDIPATGSVTTDTIRIYLIDIDSIEWHGVFPFGGRSTFEPQIFDVTQYISGTPLVEKRMALMYGTPYAKNRGEGIYRIDVSMEQGSTWNVA